MLFAILQKYDFSSKSQRLRRTGRVRPVVCDTAKVRFFKQITTLPDKGRNICELFAILQKYDFSSKSQRRRYIFAFGACCLRYCKSTIFQANHNGHAYGLFPLCVVCDTAKVRFFKQITTSALALSGTGCCLRYCKSTIFQANHNKIRSDIQTQDVVCDTAKVRFFKQITTIKEPNPVVCCCLRYCKSTIFQANHNWLHNERLDRHVVCDTAKVRFFKQITTKFPPLLRLLTLFAILQKYDFSSKSQPAFAIVRPWWGLFAILQKYDFSSKSQLRGIIFDLNVSCLRYCKSTIFQANHNSGQSHLFTLPVVCDTAKVRFFKQITTDCYDWCLSSCCLRYCKSTIFQANHNNRTLGCV